tara:strand:+ start:340 stop:1482 length:1143 start_codon:yes stop_codon:yes gene_type:complete
MNNSFKPKPSKQIKLNKTAITLDNTHQDFLKEFSKDYDEKIPKLKMEKRKVKHRLANVKSLEDKLNLQDKLKELNAEINNLKLKKKEYFLDNSNYIFEYFENKKNISSAANNNNNNKNTLVNNFFKIKDNAKDDSDNESRNNIVHKYLYNVNKDEFLNMNAYVKSTDVCQYCSKGEMIPMEDEGIMVCNLCAKMVTYLLENDKPSYKEPPNEVSFYAYKRINHFKEILAQFQGKETTQIPPEVIDNIKLQIKKERIGLDEITNSKTKEILKKLGYNKYYEHIQFIKDKLGIKPPVMSQELEGTMCNLFMELQAPYSKFCPGDRVNFLNYYYTAYKLCELLGEAQYLEFFPMLKDRDKRIEQDNIWKKICEELDWSFIPTI